MGLDSVVLLVTVEEYFGIQVSNLEAQRIVSVQDMVDCVAKQLNITDQKSPLKLNFFEKLKSILIRFQLTDNSFSLTDKPFLILNPDDKEFWAKLSEELDLQIPPPFMGAGTGIKKIFAKGWRPKYYWQTITVDEFITAICANNYKKLIHPKAIKDIYEILIATIAITKDCLGVDIYEIQPNKRFVEDFRID